MLLCNNLGIGAVPAPFDCYLAMRGTKTLHVRMKRHEENAQKVAAFLEKHPKVTKVIYPGKMTQSLLTIYTSTFLHTFSKTYTYTDIVISTYIYVQNLKTHTHHPFTSKAFESNRIVHIHRLFAFFFAFFSHSFIHLCLTHTTPHHYSAPQDSSLILSTSSPSGKCAALEAWSPSTQREAWQRYPPPTHLHQPSFIAGTHTNSYVCIVALSVWWWWWGCVCAVMPRRPARSWRI